MKKMIMRIDDVGYTKVHNIASFETLDHGIATSADIMLDTPGARDALERLRDYPWISIGWHTHFWGSPVLPAEKVPTLVGKNGHFREDIHFAKDISYDELMAEMYEEMDMCLKILGKAPDTCAFYSGDSIFEKAQSAICREFGIVTNFADIEELKIPEDGDTKTFVPKQPSEDGKQDAPPVQELDEKWRSRGIRMVGFGFANQLMTDSIKEYFHYDPLTMLIQDDNHLLDLPDDVIPLLAWHPGYVDDYVYTEGDVGALRLNFMCSRTIDKQMLCAHEAAKWIEENGIELVNMRDALYGTNEYQNHLKSIRSPLAVG